MHVVLWAASASWCDREDVAGMAGTESRIAGGYVRHAHSPGAAREDVATREEAATADDAAADGHLRAAGEAAMRQDWRGCADSYLRAYLISTPQWPLRYNTWSGFSSVLREGNVEVTRDDYQALWSVADDIDAPLLNRVQAFFTAGFVSQSAGDFAAARANYGEALRVSEDLGVRPGQSEPPCPTSCARPAPCTLPLTHAITYDSRMIACDPPHVCAGGRAAGAGHSRDDRRLQPDGRRQHHR